MEPVQVYLRFNTRNDNDNPLPWRVLLAEDGQGGGALRYTQAYAAEVRFDSPVRTSSDEVEPGVLKWHITARGYVSWLGDVCLVSERPPA
ncbi:hypothetical protein NHH82_07095 [Oxalobacteraceae bacterium OTU3REALA1]|nr:hypothetical protein NHH82_07095 [Oxalobacteraceae bacterium OTU3REALA1]